MDQMTPKNNVKRPKVSDDWFLVWRRQDSGRRSQSGELRAAACCVAQHIAGDSHERLDWCLLRAASCWLVVAVGLADQRNVGGDMSSSSAPRSTQPHLVFLAGELVDAIGW